MSPRPPILCTAAFGAGLATGLARFEALLVGAALVLAWLALTRRGGLPVLLAAAAALPWVAVLAVLLWGIHARTTRAEVLRRWAWAGVLLRWFPLVASLGPAAGSDHSGLTLDLLDIGQGGGAVLRTPHGHYVVIDAGPSTGGSGGGGAGGDDAGHRVLVPFLARQRVTEIAALIISHAHADHGGGAAAVLDRFRTDLVIESGQLYADPVYYRFLDAVTVTDVPWHAGRPGEQFTLDSVRFTLLHPDPAWPDWGEDLNEDSVVMLVEYGRFRALFMGDAGLVAERWLSGRVGRVDLLKVGHHGSRGASGDAWLDEVHPTAAVVSVGRYNTYGHPSAEMLERLRAHGAAIFRTDRDGDVEVATDGAVMTVEAAGRTSRYDVGHAAAGAQWRLTNRGAYL